MTHLVRCSLFVFASMLLTSCGGTWRVQELPAAQAADTSSQRVATIESQPDRNSPGIKTFRHFALGIELESAGSRHNDAYARERVEAPPGEVQVGVVVPHNHRTYYPVVEFDAEPGRRYFLTWICVPYPFAAITDAESSKVVALDSFCPDCSALIGATVTPSSECLRYLQPPWMKPDEKAHWLPWLVEYKAQFVRNICYAAEHGVTAARLRLAELFRFGIYGFPQDPVHAYVWYRFAASADDRQAAEILRTMETHELAPTQLQQARALFETWEQGTCATQYLGGASRSKYKIGFPE